MYFTIKTAINKWYSVSDKMTKGGGRPQVPIGMDWAEDPDYDPQDINESQIRQAYRFHLQSHMGDNPPCK